MVNAYKAGPGLSVCVNCYRLGKSIRQTWRIGATYKNSQEKAKEIGCQTLYTKLRHYLMTGTYLEPQNKGRKRILSAAEQAMQAAEFHVHFEGTCHPLGQ